MKTEHQFWLGQLLGAKEKSGRHARGPKTMSDLVILTNIFNLEQIFLSLTFSHSGTGG